jgi:preprotein translocase subunit SecF
MSKLSNLGHALYEGTVSIDFVGRKWLWYSISGLILVGALVGLGVRGVNLGIEFQGGVEYQVAVPAGAANQQTVEKLRNAVASEAAASDIPTGSRR